MLKFILNKIFIKRIALISLLLIPLRGLIVLLINNPGFTVYIYNLSAIFLMFVCLVGFLVPKTNVLSRNFEYKIIYNFIFFLIWLVPVLLFSREVNNLMYAFYLGMMPFYIFIVLSLNEDEIKKILYIITAIVSFSVIYEFFEINIFLERYDIAFQRQTLLRPTLFQAFGRTGIVYQPNGIFGERPHDSAQLLSMLSTIWLNQLFFDNKKSKYLNFILFFISLFSLLLTQVASNIIAALLIGFLSFVHGSIIFTKNRSYYITLILFCVLLFLLSQNSIVIELISIWTKRAGADGEWDQMKNIPVESSFDGMLFSFILGHASSFKIFPGAMMSEIAFVKILFELGFIHFLLIMSLVLYPTLNLIKNNIKFERLRFSYVYSTLTGVVSLWHYGSLFSITNIVVFYAIFSLTFKRTIFK
jgi:hypothetical protein